MAVGDEITAARYNLLQGRINTILGVGSGDDGYGQTLTSASVSVADLVTTAHMNNLFTDMSAARIHQTGAAPTSISQVTTSDLIGEFAGAVGPGGTSTDATTEITKGYADYESLMSNIEGDKFLIDGTQASSEAGELSSRATAWNGTIVHELTVTFASTNDRRYFFNSGGKIRFTADIAYSGSEAKTLNWQTMLSNMQTISMDHTNTSATGTGTGSAIGFYDLTATYQTIFTKAGSGIYDENVYKIEARTPNATTIQFKISFEDNDPTAPDVDDPLYPPTDEDIVGTITSTVTQLRATGSYVEVVTPTYSNDTTL